MWAMSWRRFSPPSRRGKLTNMSRRFQFRLRALLAVMLAIPLVLGLFGFNCLGAGRSARRLRQGLTINELSD